MHKLLGSQHGLISGGSAQPNDYALADGGSITFAPGERVQNITIQVAADALAERAETLELTLETTGDIELLQPHMTLTLLDQGNCRMMLPVIFQAYSGGQHS